MSLRNDISKKDRFIIAIEELTGYIIDGITVNGSFMMIDSKAKTGRPIRLPVFVKQNTGFFAENTDIPALEKDVTDPKLLFNKENILIISATLPKLAISYGDKQ